MSTARVRLDDLDAVQLDELNGVAALQTRIDRKYLVRPGQLDALLVRVGESARVLDIDGRRSFGYESLYFDTPSFDSYLSAARKRPDRFKVRTRRYLQAEQCWVEVKLRDRRGHTVKHRQAHDADRFALLTPSSLAYVASFPQVRDLAHELEPLLITRYERSTLLVGDMRTTIDVGVACSANGGSVGLGDGIIVETKSTGVASVVDRALWELHIRPTRISKFCLGVASLFPSVPSNRWHRILRCHAPTHPA